MTAADASLAEIEAGAKNLLLDCAGLAAGDSLLVVFEDPALGWWQADVIETVIAAAEKIGVHVERMETGPPTNERDEGIAAAMREHECTMFFARVGDQDRFVAPVTGRRIVMCYTRDIRMLASPFGSVPYTAMKALKVALDREIARARRIEIQCPLGTDLTATLEPVADPEPDDVSIHRFPMGIVSPVLAARFSGPAVMSGYLTPTGSAVYEPAVLKLDSPLVARIESGRITGFDGPPAGVRAVEDHYRHVANLFDLDAYRVHSWHAGIHPGVDYAPAEDDNPDRWGNTVFNHPRYLHFHSCGSRPPGEISWMLRDHRVELDGVALWDGGWLRPENFAGARRCLQQWPQLQALYAGQSRDRIPAKS